jgi:hypothetical protein
MEKEFVKLVRILLLGIALAWPSLGYSNEPMGVPVNKLIKISVNKPQFNHNAVTTDIKVKLIHRPKPKQPIYGPVTLVISKINQPNITLANATGYTTDGRPYLIIPLSHDRLAPREAQKDIVLRFNNPNRKKFKVRYAVYGLLAPNQVPIAEAGKDQTAFVGQDVVLDGYASHDPDGNPLTYRWILTEKPTGSDVTLDDSNIPTPRFTIDAPGSYGFQLIVNDRITDSQPDSVTIQAAAPDQALQVPGPVNLGELLVTPSIIPTSTSISVTVTTRILDAEYVPGSAVLYHIDADGNPVSKLGNFRDDGKEGDQTAGDSIFTTRITFLETQPTDIFIKASAAFRDISYEIDSLPTSIEVQPNVALNGPWAIIFPEHIIFRDISGQNYKEIPLIHKVDSTTNAEGVTTVSVTGEKGFASKNQQYAGIIRIQGESRLIPGNESENQSVLGEEFRYLDVSGTLWTRNPEGLERSFYAPEYSSIISDDGERILLIEVSEENTEPLIAVYNKFGRSLFRETIGLSALTEARISTNGRYILLLGLPQTPQDDQQMIMVIDVDNPATRWSEIYSAAIVTSESILENDLGGFDIWINDTKLFTFPK